MNERVAISNIQAVLANEIILPTIVMWNRLEGRPRQTNFTKALRAEIRDPLWMLTKQWQMGEFKGDDAASPVSAKLKIDMSRLTKYRPGQSEAVDFPDENPLEAVVEKMAIPLNMDGSVLSLDIRLLMGRQWRKLLSTLGLDSHYPAFIAQYPVKDPDPEQRADAALTAHPSVWQSFTALAGRAMDGAELYAYLKVDTLNRAHDNIPMPVADSDAIEILEVRFIDWFEALYFQPPDTGNQAWQPNQLEYQFDVSAPEGEAHKVLTAREYYHGHLDWYNLNVDPNRDHIEPNEPTLPADGPDVQSSQIMSFIPTGIEFDGIPNTRWWTFEEGKVNFGDIAPDTTDINKLLFMEFGLIYANDWFLIPMELPAGSLANVKGLTVTNVFGERTWIEAAGSGPDDNWQRWSMYNLSVEGIDDAQADTTLVLLPSVPKIQEGKPLEDFRLVRDEVSNMVWAVEARIPLATGWGKVGPEAGRELTARYTTILDNEIEGGLVIPDLPDIEAPIQYKIMKGVPENWIPFIPVHIDGSNREIQLQRASMPRIIQGDPNPSVKIKPRTSLLRQGLEENVPLPYFLFEEEVPRSGVRVTQSYQRTRWANGAVFNWLGVRKMTGRGEGHSGLAFDRIENTKGNLRLTLRRFKESGS